MDAWLEVLSSGIPTPEAVDYQESPEEAQALKSSRASRWVVQSPNTAVEERPQAAVETPAPVETEDERAAFRKHFASQRVQQKENTKEQLLYRAFTNYGTSTLEVEMISSTLMDGSGTPVNPGEMRNAKKMFVSYAIQVRHVLGEKGVRDGDLQKVCDQTWIVHRRYKQFQKLHMKFCTVSGFTTRPLDRNFGKRFGEDVLRVMDTTLKRFLADTVEQRDQIFAHKTAKFAYAKFLSPIQMGDTRPDDFIQPMALEAEP
jgi:hypothetical protein